MLLQLDTVQVYELTEVTKYIEGVGFKVTNGVIIVPLKHIVEKVLEDGPDLQDTASKKIANSIRKILRFTVKAGTGNRRMVYVPLTFLQELYPNHPALAQMSSLSDFTK